MSIKQQVYQQWNEIPEWFQAGEPLDGLETYSRAYFEEGKRLRYRPERFECIRDFVDFPAYKDQLLIEVGTGQGCDLNEFAAAGAHVIGADLSQRNCLVAQQRLETYGRQGHFVNVDAESIPLCDNAVDHVYSFGVLHHTPDMFGAFQEVARIVKPGGTVTMMLYRKNWSLWRWQCTYLGWFFLQTVKSDRWLGFYRRLGDRFRIKSFMDDQLLNNFQKAARARKYTLDEICAFMTDGPNNPLSQFVSPADIRSGFPTMEPLEFYRCYLGPVPLVNRVLPSSWRRAAARLLGGFLFFRLRKPLDGHAPLQPRSGFTTDEFRSLLVDPIEKQPVRWQGDYVEAVNGDRYPVISGIPMLRAECRLEPQST